MLWGMPKPCMVTHQSVENRSPLTNRSVAQDSKVELKHGREVVTVLKSSTMLPPARTEAPTNPMPKPHPQDIVLARDAVSLTTGLLTTSTQVSSFHKQHKVWPGRLKFLSSAARSFTASVSIQTWIYDQRPLPLILMWSIRGSIILASSKSAKLLKEMPIHILMTTKSARMKLMQINSNKMQDFARHLST